MRLSNRAAKLAVSAVLALFVGACSWNQKEDDIGSDPIRVQIPVYRDGSYQLAVVELKTLKDVSSLKGTSAQFLLDPAAQGDRLVGRSPEIHYIRDRNGVIVPKDALSLEFLTVYAHFEKLKEMDDQLGLSSVLNYPRKVAASLNAQNLTIDEENNALYSGQYDAFLIFPYTRDSLPMMANAGVLGHEHFHALFQKLLIEPLKDKYPNPRMPTPHSEKKAVSLMGLDPLMGIASGIEAATSPHAPLHPQDSEGEVERKRNLYHATLFRGINEGLADVWGWIYSGDDRFVGRSLPEQKMIRDIDVGLNESWRLSSSDDLRSAIDRNESDKSLIYRAYQHGTQLARAIRNFAAIYAQEKKLSAPEVRPMIAKYLISSLAEVGKEYQALQANEYFTLSHVVSAFAAQVPDLDSRSCFFLGKVMPQEGRQQVGLEALCRKIEAQERNQKP